MQADYQWIFIVLIETLGDVKRVRLIGVIDCREKGYDLGPCSDRLRSGEGTSGQCE
jgi:hypothetical protein